MILKAKDIKPLREQLLIEQNGLCKLCGEELTLEEAVLDHCHKSGKIRAAIHRCCNTYLGVIENRMVRCRITEVKLEYITANLSNYRRDLRDEIHPSHGKVKRKKTPRRITRDKL